MERSKTTDKTQKEISMKTEKEIIRLAKLEAKKVKQATDLTEFERGYVAGYNKAKKKPRNGLSSWFRFSLFNK